MLNAVDRSEGAPALGLRQRWPWADRKRAMFAAGFVLASAITALAVWLVASAPGSGPIAPASRTLMIVLVCNLFLIMALAGVVGTRVARLVKSRRDDAGSRLHLRFVTLF